MRQTRPFVVKDQGYLIPKKSVFNRVIGDSHLELQFASFLENCPDVVSYAKNYLAVHFKLDYVNADGNISNYYPNFLVKLDDKNIVIVETKGQEDLDVPLKTARLKQWCEDINRVQSDVTCDFVFVDEESSKSYSPKSFANLVANFRQYKEVPRSRVLLDTRLIHDSWRKGCRDERTKARGGFGGGRPQGERSQGPRASQ